MNYAEHYARLIERATHKKLDGFVFEHHHIVPVCLGGDDSKDNLVALTPEEHFVAHRLLAKMFPDSLALQKAYYKMAYGHMLPSGINNKVYGAMGKALKAYAKAKYPKELHNWDYNCFILTLNGQTRRNLPEMITLIGIKPDEVQLVVKRLYEDRRREKAKPQYELAQRLQQHALATARAKHKQNKINNNAAMQ